MDHRIRNGGASRRYLRTNMSTDQPTNMPVWVLLCNLAIGLALAACSAGAPVRVLERGQTIITGSVGGPIVPSSSPVGFVPYVTAGMAHGASEHITVHGNAHLLMAGYKTVGVDVGASARAVRQKDAIPEVTLGLRALMFTDLSSIDAMRFYPDAQATFSWEVADRTLVYAGAHTTFQLSPYRFLFSPMTGAVIPIGTGFSLQAEVIWQAANVNTSSGVFEGESSIGELGSLGAFLGGMVWL